MFFPLEGDSISLPQHPSPASLHLSIDLDLTGEDEDLCLTAGSAQALPF